MSAKCINIHVDRYDTAYGDYFLSKYMGKAAIHDEKCMRLESVFESHGFYQMFWSLQVKINCLRSPMVVMGLFLTAFKSGFLSQKFKLVKCLF